MTKTSVVVSVVSLLIGYLLGNAVPLLNFSTDEGPAANQDNEAVEPTSIPDGKGLLMVTVVNASGAPMVGIEIDVNFQPGQPEGWGVKEADANGTATFELDPGTYSVYFNANRFPVGYQTPPTQRVEVREGEIKTVTITLEKIMSRLTTPLSSV